MRRRLVALVAVVACCSACTAGKGVHDAPASALPAGPAAALKLVAFDSCQQLLSSLREASGNAVGPYAFNDRRLLRGADVAEPAGGDAGRAGGLSKAEGGGADPHSQTNNHEAGVDEPDIVKTDGRRIVALAGNSLQVVDAASRTVTGSLALGATDSGSKTVAGAADLLLAGDRALVLGHTASGPPMYDDDDGGYGYTGAQLTLVDLSGAPKIIGRFAFDGTLIDARQVGGTARVVLASRPRVRFPDVSAVRGDDARIAANRAAVEAAPVEAWLPEWTRTDSDGRTTSGRVDCGAVSRPTEYSGTSLLTLLSFDLGAASLGTGDPVTVVADGDTVYADGPSL